MTTIGTEESPVAAPVTALNNIVSATPPSVETITPDIASAMLRSNTHNRSIRRPLVDVYARDMAAGRWLFTGEAIKFGSDGTLLDGQHRLMAVVKAGRPVDLVVVRGVQAAAQQVMDTGAKRSTGDALSLLGEKHANTLAAVARMIIEDGGRVDVRPSSSEVIAFLDKEATVRWVVGHVTTGDLAVLKNLTTYTILGYTYWRLHRIDAFKCNEFFSQLANLANLPADSPILALNRKLQTGARGWGARAYRQETVAVIFSAWNAWRRGETRRFVKVSHVQGKVSIPDPI